jgi:hypothetical protein
MTYKVADIINIHILKYSSCPDLRFSSVAKAYDRTGSKLQLSFITFLEHRRKITLSNRNCNIRNLVKNAGSPVVLIVMTGS